MVRGGTQCVDGRRENQERGGTGATSAKAGQPGNAVDQIKASPPLININKSRGGGGGNSGDAEAAPADVRIDSHGRGSKE